MFHSPDWTLSDFRLFAAHRKHLKRIHFTCDEELRLLQENGYERSMTNITPTGSKILFSPGGRCTEIVGLNVKNYVQKQSTHSELYLCFVSLRCLVWA